LTPQSTIEICTKNFSTHGIPEEVISDNATNFDCQEFRESAKKWEFTHVTSSPHHPKGNGKAEATVKVAKRLIKKVEEEGTDLRLALLHHRNTPNKVEYSPVQRIFSRRTRCLIPTKMENLKPNVAIDIKEKIEMKKRTAKSFYDRSARDLPELKVGQPVVFKQFPETQKDWSMGFVQKRLNDRSFSIQAGGKEYRRNREHIKPRISQFESGRLEIADTLEKEIEIEEKFEENQGTLNSSPTFIDTPFNSKSPKSPGKPGASTQFQPSINTRPKRARKLPTHLRDDYVVDLTE
jgi:hypothetical protein